MFLLSHTCYINIRIIKIHKMLFFLERTAIYRTAIYHALFKMINIKVNFMECSWTDLTLLGVAGPFCIDGA